MSDNKINVQVAVRCRPLNDEEKKTGSGVVTCDTANKNIEVRYGSGNKKQSKSYNFDKVFGSYSTQEDIFRSTVKPIINDVLIGMNCTLFAYGQTGTGKTHTMEGNINSDTDSGIIPRSVKAIIERLESSGSEYTVRVSYMELYNEELQDLLVDPKDTTVKPLRLCEDVKRGVVCNNLTETAVMTIPDIFEILSKGISNRKTAATLCNKQSSRSHSIFTMKIMIKESNIEGEEIIRHGQLNLVDLAGSECVGRSGAKNDRAREAGSINQSLLTLGRVITALVDHHGHIPYRDSKLTRLLQESLGGKAKTCIIATLSPSHLCVEETLSTLEYANRAKSIKNAPQVNQKLNKSLVMKGFTSEIETLKSQLQASREKNGIYVSPEEWERTQSLLSSQEGQLRECESALKERDDTKKELQNEHESMSIKLEEKENELKVTTTNLNQALNKIEDLESRVVKAENALKESEAIITEHVTTENSLTNAANTMKSELIKRRAEVDSLVNKVNELYKLDSDNLTKGKNFHTSLDVLHQSVVSRLAKASEQGMESTNVMTTRVSDMLVKGESISKSLSESIKKAVEGLKTDINKVQEQLFSSCDGVSGAMNASDEAIVISLRNAQKEMSVWMKTLSEKLTGIKSELANQNENVSHMHSDVMTLNDQVLEFASELLETQDKSMQLNITKMNQEAEDLKTQMCAVIDTMVTNNSTQLNDSLSSGKMMTTKLKGNMSTQMKSIGVSYDNLNTGLKGIVGNIDETSVESGTTCTAFEKRFVGVIDTVHAAIATGLKEVDVIKENINEVTNTVSVASNKMIDAKNIVTVDQTKMLSENCDSLKSDLNVLGETITGELNTSSNEVGKGKQMSIDFMKVSSDNAAKASGTTPKKISNTSLPVLQMTKSHDNIRTAVQNGTFVASVVSKRESGASTLSIDTNELTSTSSDIVSSEESSPMEVVEAVVPTPSTSTPKEVKEEEEVVEVETTIAPTPLSSPPIAPSSPVIEKVKEQPEVRRSARKNKRTSQLQGPKSRRRTVSENSDPQTTN